MEIGLRQPDQQKGKGNGEWSSRMLIFQRMSDVCDTDGSSVRDAQLHLQMSYS